jgi:hypothetical protein
MVPLLRTCLLEVTLRAAVLNPGPSEVSGGLFLFGPAPSHWLEWRLPSGPAADWTLEQIERAEAQCEGLVVRPAAGALQRVIGNLKHHNVLVEVNRAGGHRVRLFHVAMVPRLAYWLAR